MLMLFYHSVTLSIVSYYGIQHLCLLSPMFIWFVNFTRTSRAFKKIHNTSLRSIKIEFTSDLLSFVIKITRVPNPKYPCSKAYTPYKSQLGNLFATRRGISLKKYMTHWVLTNMTIPIRLLAKILLTSMWPLNRNS